MMRRKRRIPSKPTRIKGTITTPSFSNCTLGKYRALDERESAVAEYNDQRGFLVHSGPTASPNTYGNWKEIKTGADDKMSVAWVQYQTSTTEFTKSTSKSGAQAVFVTEIGTADFLYNNSISLFKQLPNPVTGQSQSTQNFRVGSLMQETSITNSSNIYWQMTLYDYVARRDTYDSLGTISKPTPLHMWAQGLYYSSNTISPSSNLWPWTVKCTPFQSQMFTQFYKVVKTTTVWLGPGATHTHVMKNHLNKLLYPARFSITTGLLQNVTCGTIWTIIGQPVEATTATSPPTNKVTTGIVDGTVVTKIRANAAQKYVNKRVYNPETGTNFYQETAANGAFKALLDNSYEYKATLEGG